jgi:hypothetical protein
MSRQAHARVLDRAAEWFVAPPVEEPLLAAQPTLDAQAPRAVVLGTADDAPPVAAALAGALRAATRAPAAVTAVWSPASPDHHDAAPLAFPASRRLAARLSARALEASARGRLAWVALPSLPGDAAMAARRVAVIDAPVVAALGGPRTPALDGLMPEQDLIVVVAPDPTGPLARSALAGLHRESAVLVACRPLPRPARVIALAGMGGTRLLDPPLRAAVRRLA